MVLYVLLCFRVLVCVLIVMYFAFRALHHCEQMIQRYSREVSLSSGSALPQSSHSNVGKAVEDCMRAVIGVLLNLTHDNGERQNRHM